MPRVDFEMIVFREGQSYVAYCPELDVSSCGKDIEEARRNLKTAVRLFVEEAEKTGTLADILEEAGYVPDGKGGYESPRLVATESASVAVGS
jgi:predicted RNase H-like HicB family nuclease